MTYKSLSALSLFVLLAVVSIISGTAALAGSLETPAEVKECLRCHSMETLGYQDRDTGKLVNLHVPLAGFSTSNHGELTCVNCHQKGYDVHPHTEKAKAETLYCLDCHDDPKNPKFKDYRFKEVEAEFKKSVHYERHADKFTCFSCHDPHAFEVAKKKVETAAIIEQDNAMCANCHRSPVRFADITTKRTVPDLEATHAWLPNAKLHWSKVRCVECHTPHDQANFSHVILKKETAERNCVVCHTKDSMLLTTLYRHSVTTSREKTGFINATILNDAYIIGATRNQFLDWLSFGIIGAAGGVVFAHGMGRWISGKRKKK